MNLSLAVVGVRSVGRGLRRAIVNGLRPRVGGSRFVRGGVRGRKADQNQSNDPKGEFNF
jgi:hypothetical protein